ncbi:type 2 periplasmic-binding domain-containing protein [Caballeronia telluris]|uniref:LysR family transcriptional regulator n=1 Tax=Caballeronia telluris TaxID=326475 RepID=A0A158G7T3_9BURK|nr:hypothetical protein [Caballeronia telluris]SAL28102.1 hypothetical protein AWB66_01641 [Caballeronia telluris]
MAPRFASSGTTASNGALDLAIGYLGKMGENLHQQPLFRRSLVGIVKGGATRKKVWMTLDEFVGRKHVVAGTLALTNQSSSPRPISLRPCPINSPSVLAARGCRRVFVADQASRSDGPAVLRARHHNDARHRWFRELVAETLGQTGYRPPPRNP